MTLVAFDFDNTLSDSMMLALLCQRGGVQDQNREITKRVEADDLGYTESLRERVSLLAGCSRTDLEAVCEQISLRPGAPELLQRLRATGVTTAIVSGGFERCIENVLDRAGVDTDYVVANRVEIRDGVLTGNVTGRLVERTKAAVLRNLRVSAEEVDGRTVAVGDGRTDLPMLRAADMAIGIQPTPMVRPHCDTVVSNVYEIREILESENVI